MNGRHLLAELLKLSAAQLDGGHLTVTAGCDANGNAEFFPLFGLCVVGDGTVDAAAGAPEVGSPVLLFDQDCEDF